MEEPLARLVALEPTTFPVLSVYLNTHPDHHSITATEIDWENNRSRNTKDNLELTRTSWENRGDEHRLDFDDSNDSQSCSRAWEPGAGARAENLDSFGSHSVALNGRHGTVFVIRRRTVIDNLERRGLTNLIDADLRYSHC